jgi:glyoxylase I family protein
MTPDPLPGLGGYHHLNLSVSDVERSAAWYCEVLGFTNVRDFERESFRRVFLLHPRSQFFLGLKRHHSPPAESRFSEVRTGMDHVAFAVGDRDVLETWAVRLTRLGVTHSGIKEATSGAVITLRDPDNIQLELYAPPSQV